MTTLFCFSTSKMSASQFIDLQWVMACLPLTQRPELVSRGPCTVALVPFAAPSNANMQLNFNTLLEVASKQTGDRKCCRGTWEREEESVAVFTQEGALQPTNVMQACNCDFGSDIIFPDISL